jgi:peptidoglycan-N-acetylglucosamine deacetylase
VAVLLSFDVDNQTPALSAAQDPRATSIGTLSRGEYGARTGLQRVLAALDRDSIPASFFIPAMSLELNPEMVAAIRKSNRHEFAVHGWIHEQNPTLPADVERDLVGRALARLEQLTGVKPVGYRAPSWNFSPNTLRILRDLGFLYDSSLMADDRPYELLENGERTGVIELPVEWILDDAPLVDPQGQRYSAPRDVLQVYIDELNRGFLRAPTVHPHIIGHRSRIVVLEKLIEHIKAKGGAWFATHRQLAEYVKPGLRQLP